MPYIANRLNVFVCPVVGGLVAQFRSGDPARERALAGKTHPVDEGVRGRATGNSTMASAAFSWGRPWGPAVVSPVVPPPVYLGWQPPLRNGQKHRMGGPCSRFGKLVLHDEPEKLSVPDRAEEHALLRGLPSRMVRQRGARRNVLRMFYSRCLTHCELHRLTVTDLLYVVDNRQYPCETSTVSLLVKAPGLLSHAMKSGLMSKALQPTL